MLYAVEKRPRVRTRRLAANSRSIQVRSAPCCCEPLASIGCSNGMTCGQHISQIVDRHGSHS